MTRSRGSALVLAVVVAGSMLTVAYGVRFYWGAFVAPRRRASEPRGPVADGTSRLRSSRPAAILAVVGVVVRRHAVGRRRVRRGVDQRLSGRIVIGAPVALARRRPPARVVGADPRRRCSVLVGRRPPDRSRCWHEGGAIPSGAEVYLALLRGLGIVSARVTGFVQNGSLPVYIGVILAHRSGRPGMGAAGGRGLAGMAGVRRASPRLPSSSSCSSPRSAPPSSAAASPRRCS